MGEREDTAGATATSGMCYATLKSSASSAYGWATTIKANKYVSLIHKHAHTQGGDSWWNNKPPSTKEFSTKTWETDRQTSRERQTGTGKQTDRYMCSQIIRSFLPLVGSVILFQWSDGVTVIMLF